MTGRWLFFAALSILPATAQAETWVLLPFQNLGLEKDHTRAFQAVLENELHRQKPGISVELSDRPCADAACARTVAIESRTDFVIFGALSQLGRKIVVSASVISPRESGAYRSDRITINRPEDLEFAARRLATSLLGGRTTEDSADLGQITQHEVAPPRRRAALSGTGLRVGSVVPLGTSLGNANPGIALGLSYWYEAVNFAIEPELGLRFSTDFNGPGSYLIVPFNLNAYYIFGRGNVAPFIGAGGGVRFARAVRSEQIVLGRVAQETHFAQVDDAAVGVGASARAGVMLFRTYSVRLSVHAAYDLTLIRLHDQSFPQTLEFGLGLYF